MKITLLFILTISQLALFSQEYEKVEYETDTFYILNRLDTLDLPKDLPDGRWIYYYDDSETSIVEFNIQDNFVSGLFKYSYNGILKVIGSYNKDSLWTFTKNFGINSDSTFKVGNWSYASVIVSEFKTYNIPDNNTKFVQTWTYDNNTKWVEWTWAENKELIKERTYFENGKLDKEIELINDSLIIEKKWNDSGDLVYVFQIQPEVKKCNYFRNFDPEFFGRKKEKNSEEYYISNSNNKFLNINSFYENLYILIQERNYYDNGKLKEEKNYTYSRKWNTIVIYWNVDGFIYKVEYYKNDKLKRTKKLRFYHKFNGNF
jgi:antitoxin component YwqK of YwqJK toxin-antitoxin module